MKISNFFKMNNWEIKKFSKFILLIQFVMWGLIGFDYIGLQIPILRQFIGFLYLTFIPGIIILRILRLHKLNTIETILYAVGLSITTSMFIGIFMDIFYPFFGISKPLSTNLIIITLSIFVLLLTLLSYTRDKEFTDETCLDTKKFFHPTFLFLYIIPFLAIIGTYLMNYYGNNTILMVMIILISFIFLFISFNKTIPKELYPLGIFVISLSLLYLTWLTSTYIWGRDVHSELYYSNLVLNNLYWDRTIPNTTNAMPIITLFAPMLSKICNLSSTWVYKLFFPILFSLVPLGLYEIVRKQVNNNKIAFLSAFFFSSMYFYNILLSTAKQLFAEFFIILLILLIVKKEKNNFAKSTLLIIFSVSIVLSHYATSYLFIITLLLVITMLSLMKTQLLQRSVHYFSFKFKISYPKYVNLFNTEKTVFNKNLVLFFVVFAITWYMYISNSFTFNMITHVGDHILSSIYTDILNPETAQGLAMLSTVPQTFLGYIHKYLILTTEFFIFVGLFSLVVLKRDYTNFKKEFVLFSIANFFLLIFSIVVPNFSSQIYTPRLYQITLLFLAPCAVIGGVTFIMFFKKIIKSQYLNNKLTLNSSLKILSIIFVMIFLFETGFINELEKDHSSLPLSKDFMSSNNVTDRAYFYQDLNVFEQDISGANWLSKKRGGQKQLFTDIITQNVCNFDLMSKFGNNLKLLTYSDKIDKNSYLYLGYHSVIGKVLIFDRNKVFYKDSDVNMEKMGKISYLLDNLNKVYTNGGCEVYLS
jgi:uncharacterized membrane protein